MGLAQALLQKKIVPQKVLQDAIHIAVAATSGMDFLLTWNCTRIVNTRIEARIVDPCLRRALWPILGRGPEASQPPQNPH